MNKNIKQKWLTALRSGEYKQCKGGLRIRDNFCVFGVLCDIYGKEKNVKWARSTYSDRYIFSSHSMGLPKNVLKWAGIKDQDESVINKVDNLAHQNDSGKTFNEIADIIEEQL